MPDAKRVVARRRRIAREMFGLRAQFPGDVECRTCGGEGFVRIGLLQTDVDACPGCAARAESEWRAWDEYRRAKAAQAAEHTERRVVRQQKAA